MYLRPVIMVFVQLSVLLGLVYPLVVTGLGQVLFADAANGSLIHQGDKVVGSHLLGQEFTRAEHFWGRPSATAEFAYNPMASGGSNLAATNPQLTAAAQAQLQVLATNPSSAVPVELLSASGSGLDPDISLQAALYQVPRVAQASGHTEQDLRTLVHSLSRNTLTTGFQPLVNVVDLNLAVQALPQ
ncbi:potassium-transporting ATPase subunit KdpC [Vitreoscilla massiliensis]|uniref:Potassium-transporting ATPase KdpC subunit n=1 Tax=Vitreoscilla massiliensis TaxID=1689272 RepID=A0ABY4E6P3_9NEIS|nr:potassium-transporting ATPase subunit KdpC [Vitreoscilla massiliensis]UOO91139.1 potassium-transporting ATPase subunit KdpC [Vitreoscilla massiliensis]